jgi:hypothetical protein
MLSALYNYQVIECSLVFDLVRRLMERLAPLDVELLLLLLKEVTAARAIAALGHR